MEAHDQDRAISKAQVEWLIEVAARSPLRQALDLGFGCGFSAVAMVKGGCDVICVNYEDESSVRRIEAVNRYSRLCGHSPKIVNASTDRALPRLLDDGQQFGVIFVDAGHRVDDVFVDVHYARELCVPGGVLALDDIYYAAIRVVVDWVNTNLAHIWQPFEILDNTVSWKRSPFTGDDSTIGLTHRSHAGPPKSFDIATQNADEFQHYPAKQQASALGFRYWEPKLS